MGPERRGKQGRFITAVFLYYLGVFKHLEAREKTIIGKLLNLNQSTSGLVLKLVSSLKLISPFSFSDRDRGKYAFFFFLTSLHPRMP